MREDRADAMAQFCVATGMAPSEYLRLTIRERSAFVNAMNERYGHG